MEGYEIGYNSHISYMKYVWTVAFKNAYKKLLFMLNIAILAWNQVFTSSRQEYWEFSLWLIKEDMFAFLNMSKKPTNPLHSTFHDLYVLMSACGRTQTHFCDK